MSSSTPAFLAAAAAAAAATAGNFAASSGRVLVTRRCLATGRRWSVSPSQRSEQQQQRLQERHRQHLAEARKASWVSNRLSNDNSFLSWTRNGILSTVAAVTAHGIQSPQHSSSVCICLFAYSTVAMTIGTSLYIRNLHTMRAEFGIPPLVHYAKLCGAMAQLVLWFLSVALLWRSFAEYHVVDECDERGTKGLGAALS